MLLSEVGDALLSKVVSWPQRTFQPQLRDPLTGSLSLHLYSKLA